jgi:hypothetical protein
VAGTPSSSFKSPAPKAAACIWISNRSARRWMVTRLPIVLAFVVAFIHQHALGVCQMFEQQLKVKVRFPPLPAPPILPHFSLVRFHQYFAGSTLTYPFFQNPHARDISYTLQDLCSSPSSPPTLLLLQPRPRNKQPARTSITTK